MSVTPTLFLQSVLSKYRGKKERRIDKRDGQSYTKEEFQNYYGEKKGERKFNESEVASTGPRGKRKIEEVAQSQPQTDNHMDKEKTRKALKNKQPDVGNEDSTTIDVTESDEEEAASEKKRKVQIDFTADDDDDNVDGDDDGSNDDNNGEGDDDNV